MFTRLFQKFIVSEASEIASWWSSASNMYLDSWLPSELEELPVRESMFCDTVWAKNFIGGGSASSCELVSSSDKNLVPVLS